MQTLSPNPRPFFLSSAPNSARPSAHWLRSGPFVKLGTSGDRPFCRDIVWQIVVSIRLEEEK